MLKAGKLMFTLVVVAAGAFHLSEMKPDWLLPCDLGIREQKKLIPSLEILAYQLTPRVLVEV